MSSALATAISLVTHSRASPKIARPTSGDILGRAPAVRRHRLARAVLHHWNQLFAALRPRLVFASGGFCCAKTCQDGD